MVQHRLCLLPMGPSPRFFTFPFATALVPFTALPQLFWGTCGVLPFEWGLGDVKDEPESWGKIWQSVRKQWYERASLKKEQALREVSCHGLESNAWV